ncbi:MAG: NUDIX hydrolase [Candidatus Dependentiae bacterium]|nr:NUDIX hydrolase [Candidatus Dependentiae bacterium]
MSDEILDLVSTDDVVIGQLPRSQVYAQKLSNFRVVNAFVINDQGQLWIPRRTKTKRIFPLCLDASMGGHVESGETYEQAFKRELYEELGLDANSIVCEMIGRLNPHEHGTSAFMQVYIIRLNQVDAYNTQDFCEYFWLSPQECIEKLNSGDVGKGDLLKMIRQLFI